MERKHDFFEMDKLSHEDVVVSAPKKFFPQETDWTCSIACIRTLLSGFLREVPGEIFFIESYHLIPGPHYSKDIKRLNILEKYDVKFGCDSVDNSFDKILDYMEEGYGVMVECMYNYAHWFVLLGYYPLEEGDIEKSKLLVYDPYYDEMRLLRVEEFINMWVDGNYENTRIEKDFIAIKSK